MQGKQLARTVAIILILCLAACRESAQPTPTPEPSAANLAIAVSAQPEPLVVGTTTLIITITDSGQPVAGVEVAVHGDMNHAGMQPVDAVGTTDGSGVTTVPFRWSMAGDWIVTVTATLPEGGEVNGTFNFTVGT